MNEHFRMGGIERRCGIDRRQSKDRRDEIRFELGKKNRRQSPGRRAEDMLGWSKAAAV